MDDALPEVINDGSFLPAFPEWIASACADTEKRSQQSTFVGSSRSASTGEGLWIHNADSAVTSLQSLLTLATTAPERVEIPLPLLPALRRPVKASGAKTPQSLALDGKTLFQPLLAHESALSTSCHTLTPLRRSQQKRRREPKLSTGTMLLEMIGTNVDGLYGDKRRPAARPNSQNN